jgi:hypothetical protein
MKTYCLEGIFGLEYYIANAVRNKQQTKIHGVFPALQVFSGHLAREESLIIG